jgi:uncharacterized protein with PQ loop repeat
MTNGLMKYKEFDRIIAPLAGLITITYAIIQIIHTHRTQDVNGISLPGVILVVIANMLLLLHGCFIEDDLIIVISGTNILLNIYRIYLYQKFCNKVIHQQ